MATKMDQDSPKRAPEGAKSDEKELQDAKWEMLILARFFFNENEVLEDLVGVIVGTFGDHVGSCWVT